MWGTAIAVRKSLNGDDSDGYYVCCCYYYYYFHHHHHHQHHYQHQHQHHYDHYSRSLSVCSMETRLYCLRGCRQVIVNISIARNVAPTQHLTGIKPVKSTFVSAYTCVGNLTHTQKSMSHLQWNVTNETRSTGVGEPSFLLQTNGVVTLKSYREL